MASARENIMAEVHRRLETLSGPKVTRAEVLPEAIPEAGLVNLREGEPELEGETLGVVSRLWVETLEMELVIAGADGPARAAALDALAASVAQALDVDPATGGDPTLGGLADHADLQPLRSVDDVAVAGATPLRAAVLPLEVHYATGANPVG